LISLFKTVKTFEKTVQSLASHIGKIPTEEDIRKILIDIQRNPEQNGWWKEVFRQELKRIFPDVKFLAETSIFQLLKNASNPRFHKEPLNLQENEIKDLSQYGIFTTYAKKELGRMRSDRAKTYRDYTKEILQISSSFPKKKTVLMGENSTQSELVLAEAQSMWRDEVSSCLEESDYKNKIDLLADEITLKIISNQFGREYKSRKKAAPKRKKSQKNSPNKFQRTEQGENQNQEEESEIEEVFELPEPHPTSSDYAWGRYIVKQTLKKGKTAQREPYVAYKRILDAYLKTSSEREQVSQDGKNQSKNPASSQGGKRDKVKNGGKKK